MYSFVHDLPEYGLQGSKNVGTATQNNTQLFMVTRAIS